jgi:four helix bundle protein
MGAHNYRELKVWKQSMSLVKEVYVVTVNFPETEKCGLISQIRRCAISIPSNIAEGCSRISDKDFARFLSISLGSAYELETQLLLSSELNFVKEENIKEIMNKIHELQRMLYALQQKSLASII